MMATILEQIGESVRGFSIVHAMPVLEHQREGLFVRMQAVDQGVKNILGRIFQMPFELLLKRVREFWHGAPNRLNQVGEKPDRVVVVAIDSQPCALQTLLGKDLAPLRGQGALPVAGGRVNEDQLWSSPRAEAVEDSLPRHRRAIECRRSESCRGARRGLCSRDRA